MGDVGGGDGFAGGGDDEIDGCAGVWGCGGACGGLCGWGGCGAIGLDFPDDGADGDFLALGYGDSEDAVCICFEVVGDFIGL